ncbi:MAG TPA: fucose isomerase [Planctomycetota bacterium]|nr:fucose isomerase [Planctomycetota bacterium]
MGNLPAVKIAVVGVSRDCFPIDLTKRRLARLMAELKKLGVPATACPTVIESEADALKALDQARAAGANAAVLFLGNFGPEGPTTIFAQRFPGPVMFCAAAEESREVLLRDRGDALCGLLNASYNLGLRKVRAHIPERPVGLAVELAAEIARFEAIARVVIGVRSLKLFGFGPRPQDFLACNAPVKPLYDLGVEVMENSELDLLGLYRAAAGRKAEIAAVVRDMKKELGTGCTYPDLLPRLAQFEVALVQFMEKNLGAARYAAFADKCWPAFENEFGFVPCYVNSRLAGRGIPVACEVDLYGALSEYMIQAATGLPATLLDINNSVPADILPEGADLAGAAPRDLFMGFHCGNTTSSCMAGCALNYQVIMNRLMEGGKKPDITRGTLEGRLRPGAATLFRLQSTADCQLRSYVAEGRILDVDPCSFGSIGVFAIPGFARFYRHVLIGKRYPHHGAVGFAPAGGVLFDALRVLGVEDIATPPLAGERYAGENPFEVGS